MAFFAAINLFSWNGRFWFQWPSLAVLFVFALRASSLYRREEGEDPPNAEGAPPAAFGQPQVDKPRQLERPPGVESGRSNKA